MKMIQKSRLASALTAAVGGLSMLALGSPVYADGDRMEDEGVGDVLIFPYYTTRDGWTSLVNVTNTKSFTIIAKVRYRESYNSRDVLDFNIVLSPFDVWTGWVAEGPNGPRLYTRDATCTSPTFTEAGDGSRYVDFTNVGYQKDGGPTDIDRAREGHYEVLTMGQFYPGAEDEEWDENGQDDWEGNNLSWSKGDPRYPTAYYAKHVDGQPRNCAMVDSRFEATASVPSESDFMEGDFDSDGDPLAEWDNERARDRWYFKDRLDSDDDTLKGNFGLVNFADGMAVGGVAQAPKNPFCNEDGDHWQDHDLITAQQWPWFMEPTLYSMCDLDDGEENGNNRYWGLWGWNTNYSADLDVAGINNEWSTNPNTGAETDWIVTFPTKEFHVDISDTDPYAAISSARMLKDGEGDGAQCEYDSGADKPWSCDLWDNGDPDVMNTSAETFEGAFIAAGGMYFSYEEDCDGDCVYRYRGFEEVFDGQSCDTVVYNLWDREEEGVAGSGTSISPAPPQPVDSLCYETNILAFQDDSTLGSALAVKVDTGVLTSGAAAGWLKLFMGDGCNLKSTEEGDYCDYESELPVVGFAVKSRDFGDPTRNFGVLVDHGFDD